MRTISIKVIKWIVVLAMVFGAWYMVFVADQAAAQEPQIRYIPDDEIEWVLESTNNDEIITIDQIMPHIWDFKITPNPTRLSIDEISNYPFELFHIVESGSDTELRKYKVPVNMDDYIIQSIPIDTKVTQPTYLTDIGKIDLSTNDGFTLYCADPGILANSYLKIGVHSATYSAISNVITVTGSPVTYQDIYNADVANGWGVFFQCGGTQQFFSTAKIYYGDDSTPTLLEDMNISLAFSKGINVANFQILQQVETNAIVRLDHCHIIDEDDAIRGNIQWNYSGGVINFNNTMLSKLVESTSDRSQISGFGTNSYLIDCNLYNMVISQSELNMTNVTSEYSLFSIYQPKANSIFNNVNVRFGLYGVAVGGVVSSTFENCNIQGTTDIYQVNSTATTTFINSELSNWSSFCSGICTAGLDRIYTLDMMIETYSGTPIQNANIIITDVDGIDIANLYTSISGTISTQNLLYGKYASGTTVATMKTPHILTINAIGYNEYTQDIFMDEQKDLEISLTPTNTGTTASDVLSWSQANLITMSWWEENMELIVQIMMIGILAFLACWRSSMLLYIVAAAGIGFIGAEWWDTKSVEWGMPIVALSVVLFIRGIWLPISGRFQVG